MCRRWSHHCSNGNADSANRRDEQFVHVFPPRARLVPIRAVSLNPKGLLNRLVGVHAAPEKMPARAAESGDRSLHKAFDALVERQHQARRHADFEQGYC
jgi:hypothetical protein